MINVLLFEDLWDSNNQPVIDTISKTNSKKEHLISHFETITVTKFEARWVDDKKNYRNTLVQYKLELAINYLLDNGNFTVGNSAFRQLIEIDTYGI